MLVKHLFEIKMRRNKTSSCGRKMQRSKIMAKNTVDCECDNVVFVNITQSYGKLSSRRKIGLPPVKGRENVYECTRKYWKLSKAHADHTDYIAGVFRNEIKSVYEFADGKKWQKVRDCPDLADDEEVRENPKYKDERFAFSGKKPSPEVQHRYVGKGIDFDFGRNPVRYNFSRLEAKKRRRT